MERATISQVKNGLSAYLRKVRAGQSVLILDRDQPVAVLQAVDGEVAPEGKLIRLEQRGLVRRSATSNPQGALSGPIQVSRSVIDALHEERSATR